MAQDPLARAVAALAALGPWPEGGRVALAFSGGADSVFLACAWRAFAFGRDLTGRALIVDHRHRPDTTAEAAAAAAAARALDLPAEVLAAERIGAGEDALRRARYAALKSAMAAGGESVLLFGHHADDQAETVLLRLLRGSGLRGLAGMPARRPLGPGRELRRPLLELRRDEIRSWLRAEGIGWQEDPTNDDLRAAARNRLRAEALPALTGVGAGDPVAGLLRLAAEARAWIEAAPAVRERVGDWRELPSALRRLEIAERLREAGETPSPRRLDDLERALLQRGAAGLRPGLGLRLAGGDLVLAERR